MRYIPAHTRRFTLGKPARIGTNVVNTLLQLYIKTLLQQLGCLTTNLAITNYRINEVKAPGPINGMGIFHANGMLCTAFRQASTAGDAAGKTGKKRLLQR